MFPTSYSDVFKLEHELPAREAIRARAAARR